MTAILPKVQPPEVYPTGHLDEVLNELLNEANKSVQSMHLAGVGPFELEPCSRCRGVGTVRDEMPEDLWPGARVDCEECRGTGEVAVCVDEFELLRRALRRAYKDLRKLQVHVHEWDVRVDENGPTYCVICGANGDA